MKIEDNSVSNVTFKDIKPGVVFRYRGEIYMSIDSDMIAIDLLRGKQVEIRPDENIDPISNAKLVIPGLEDDQEYLEEDPFSIT